jgi:hypothetical protein
MYEASRVAHSARVRAHVCRCVLCRTRAIEYKVLFHFLYFFVSWLMVRIDLRSMEAASTLTGLPVLRRMAMNLLRRCERTGRHDEPTTNPAHGRRTRGASKIFGVVTRRPSRERWMDASDARQEAPPSSSPSLRAVACCRGAAEGARKAPSGEQPAFVLARCNGLRSNGPAVSLHILTRRFAVTRSKLMRCVACFACREGASDIAAMKGA